MLLFKEKCVEEVLEQKIRSDGVSKTVKHEIKETEHEVFGKLLENLGASMSINILTEKGVMRAGKGVEAGKGVRRAGRRYNNKNYMDKNY